MKARQEEDLQKYNDWLAKRKKVVSGTEVGVLLGVSPWMTPAQLYESKISEPPFVSNDYVVVGKALESGAIQYLLHHDFGIDAGSFNKYEFFVNAKGTVGTTPDGYVADLDENSPLSGRLPRNSLLEYKTLKTAFFKRWLDHPPLYYLAQCQAQLLSTPLNRNPDQPLSAASPGYEAVGLVAVMRNDTLGRSIWKVSPLPQLIELIEHVSADFMTAVQDGTPYEADSDIPHLAQGLLLKSFEFLSHGGGHKDAL